MPKTFFIPCGKKLHWLASFLYLWNEVLHVSPNIPLPLSSTQSLQLPCLSCLACRCDVQSCRGDSNVTSANKALVILTFLSLIPSPATQLFSKEPTRSISLLFPPTLLLLANGPQNCWGRTTDRQLGRECACTIMQALVKEVIFHIAWIVSKFQGFLVPDSEFWNVWIWQCCSTISLKPICAVYTLFLQPPQALSVSFGFPDCNL